MKDESYIFNLGRAFQKIVQENTGRIAIQYSPQEFYTYGQIDLISNRWLNFLLSRGIKSQDVVAILNEKSISSLTLMIGCLKAGVIYTNLDPSSPSARLNKIIERCQPKMIFSDIGLDISGLIYSGELVDSKQLELEQFSDEFVESGFDGTHAAYIMFTSGSTGFPKGAVISHSNLLNFIQWGKSTYAIQSSDVFTNANPIYFDNSVFDFYISLFSGATLVPLSHDLVKNARNLVSAIAVNKCTIWFSVPSLLVYLLTTKVLTTESFPCIRTIVFGGEGFPKNKLIQLYRMFSKRVSIHNVYGPTECTCICSSHRVTEDDFINMNELTTLGQVAPNFDFVILADGEDKKIGELCLLGPCVGMGYYNDLERTKLSFIIQDLPYRRVCYRTGDLVELTSSGNLNFRGRVDNQIKHMGYRIELEEIESAYASLPEIDEVGVVYQRLTEEFGQIVAFVTINSQSITPDDLLDKIRGILPQYMIPRSQVFLDKLPKNQNGKIDRNQLRQML